MKKLVLASQNKGKIKEIKSILKDLDIEVLGISDIISIEDIEENANTLEGNAKIKAEYVHKLIGGYTLADDTGLFVESLNMEPGVHTARYAGENSSDSENRKKLLENLSKEEDRRAFFKTVLVLIDDKGKEYIVDGICSGFISEEERGKTGFGYDKVFIPEGYNETFSELSSEIKNKVSHRAKALDELKILLVEVLNENSDY